MFVQEKTYSIVLTRDAWRRKPITHPFDTESRYLPISFSFVPCKIILNVETLSCASQNIIDIRYKSRRDLKLNTKQSIAFHIGNKNKGKLRTRSVFQPLQLLWRPPLRQDHTDEKRKAPDGRGWRSPLRPQASTTSVKLRGIPELRSKSSLLLMRHFTSLFLFSGKHF